MNNQMDLHNQLDDLRYFIQRVERQPDQKGWQRVYFYWNLYKNISESNNELSV